MFAAVIRKVVVRFLLLSVALAWSVAGDVAAETISCPGSSDCAFQTLTFSGSPQLLDCSGTDACRGATVNFVPGGSMSIECSGQGSCRDAVVNIASGGASSLTCADNGSAQTCLDIVVNRLDPAPTTGGFTLDCGFPSNGVCQGAQFFFLEAFDMIIDGGGSAQDVYCGESFEFSGTITYAVSQWVLVGECATFMLQVCGNGEIEGSEECDDSNTTPGDGCSDTCQLEFCGDNVVQAGLGEQCDDGGTVPGDGCDATCQDEFCGDGVIQAGLGEACDDGGTVPGDGCSETCALQAGWTCQGEPSVCTGPPTIRLRAPSVVSDDKHGGPSGVADQHIIFSEPLTFTASDVVVVDALAAPVAFSVQGSGTDQMHLTFDTPLFRDTYTITIRDTATSVATGAAFDGDADGVPGGDAVIAVEHALRPASAPAIGSSGMVVLVGSLIGTAMVAFGARRRVSRTC